MHATPSFGLLLTPTTRLTSSCLIVESRVFKYVWLDCFFLTESHLVLIVDCFFLTESNLVLIVDCFFLTESNLLLISLFVHLGNLYYIWRYFCFNLFQLWKPCWNLRLVTKVLIIYTGRYFRRQTWKSQGFCLVKLFLYRIQVHVALTAFVKRYWLLKESSWAWNRLYMFLISFLQ